MSFFILNIEEWLNRRGLHFWEMLPTAHAVLHVVREAVLLKDGRWHQMWMVSFQLWIWSQWGIKRYSKKLVSEPWFKAGASTWTATWKQEADGWLCSVGLALTALWCWLLKWLTNSKPVCHVVKVQRKHFRKCSSKYDCNVFFVCCLFISVLFWPMPSCSLCTSLWTRGKMCLMCLCTHDGCLTYHAFVFMHRLCKRSTIRLCVRKMEYVHELQGQW